MIVGKRRESVLLDLSRLPRQHNGLRKGRAVVAMVTGAIIIAVGATAGCGVASSNTQGTGNGSSTSGSDVPPGCTYSVQIALKVGAIQTDWINEDGPDQLDPVVSQAEDLERSAAGAVTDPQAKQAFEKEYADTQAFGSALTTANRAGVNYGNGYDNAIGQAVETALSTLVHDDSQHESLHLCS